MTSRKELIDAAVLVLDGLDSYLDEKGYGPDGVLWFLEANTLRQILEEEEEGE